jgi:uridine kinase
MREVQVGSDDGHRDRGAQFAHVGGTLCHAGWGDVEKEWSRPFVVAISGSVASGKTTLVERLAELLGGPPVLIFDDYDQTAEWPPDVDEWIRAGADPDQVSVPRLREDLLSLLAGRSITHPLDNRTIHPADVILVEEPSGRERREIGETIDLLVYVDVPQDVCAMRVVQRALGMTGAESDAAVEAESREALVGRLRAVASWLARYERMRLVYIGVSTRVKRTADIVVDGMGPVDDMARQVLDAIERLKAPP